MNTSLDFKTIVRLISCRTNLSEQTVRRVYKELINVFLEELKLENNIKLDGLGTFKPTIHPATDKIVSVFGETPKPVYVPPYVSVAFKLDTKTKKLLNSYILPRGDKKQSLTMSPEHRMKKVQREMIANSDLDFGRSPIEEDRRIFGIAKGADDDMEDED